MLQLNHIRQEKEIQAFTDPQCGFCGCVTLSRPSKYSCALTSMSFSAKIFNTEIETKLIQQALPSQREWKRYIDGAFLWDCKRNKVHHFIKQQLKLTHSTQQ